MNFYKMLIPTLFWHKGLSASRDAGDTSLRDPETNLIYICPRPTDNLRIIY